MKITKSQLKRIIKEEVESALNEMEAPGGISPEDVAQGLRDLIAANPEKELTEESVEQAVIEAGVLDDDIENFADEVWVILLRGPDSRSW
jgi:hypothetical protein